MGSRGLWSSPRQDSVVEPVDVFEGGVFDVVEVSPWSPVSDQFCFVEADHRLGQGVVIRVADRSDRR